VTDRRTPVRTEIAEPAALPAGTEGAALRPGVETTRWTPPQDFAAKLVTAPPSGVEATMDDQQLSTRMAPLVAQAPVAPRVRSGPPQAPEARPPVASHPSFVETMPPAEAARAPRTATRALVLVVMCFLLGALGMGAVAYRAGLLGGLRTGDAQREAVLALANDALAHQRWDTPPGDNVRDITTEALAKWPGDAQIARVRAAASEAIALAARAKHDAADPAEARRLLALAQQLDPTGPTVKRLDDEWAADDHGHGQGQGQATELKPAEPAVPPLASGRSSPGAPLPSGGARVQLDTSNARPAPGQPVDFIAHVLGASGGMRPRVDGVAFRVSGPGVAPGTQLDASDDGAGVFRTTFTFLQVGRFEIGFIARADGAPMRGTRVVVVAEPKALPAPASSSGAGPSSPAGSAGGGNDTGGAPASADTPSGGRSAPAAAPSGSTKWL
jgi:serine/threonine-protein kinase